MAEQALDLIDLSPALICDPAAGDFIHALRTISLVRSHGKERSDQPYPAPEHRLLTVTKRRCETFSGRIAGSIQRRHASQLATMAEVAGRAVEARRLVSAGHRRSPRRLRGHREPVGWTTEMEVGLGSLMDHPGPGSSLGTHAQAAGSDPRTLSAWTRTLQVRQSGPGWMPKVIRRNSGSLTHKGRVRRLLKDCTGRHKRRSEGPSNAMRPPSSTDAPSSHRSCRSVWNRERGPGFHGRSRILLLPAVVKSDSPAGQTPVLREKLTRGRLSVMASVTPQGSSTCWSGRRGGPAAQRRIPRASGKRGGGGSW